MAKKKFRNVDRKKLEMLTPLRSLSSEAISYIGVLILLFPEAAKRHQWHLTDNRGDFPAICHVVSLLDKSTLLRGANADPSFWPEFLVKKSC